MIIILLISICPVFLLGIATAKKNHLQKNVNIFLFIGSLILLYQAIH